MSISTLIEIYVFVFGLLVGSYLNVVIHRLPRGISTVLPHSRCPRCLHKIRPWDNIPLLSYLFLGRRCRDCGAPIAWRYPAIEVVTALAFLLAFRRFDHPVEMVAAAGFAGAMIVLAMIDLEHYLLPDVITLPGIIVGLALQPWLSWTSWQGALAGAALGAGLLWAVAWCWYLWKGVPGMGMGDVKMLAMIGAFLGWQGMVVTLFLASLSGSLVGVAWMLRGRLSLRSKLPFGTFLAFAAVIALFFGRHLLVLYVGPIPAAEIWPP